MNEYKYPVGLTNDRLTRLLRLFSKPDTKSIAVMELYSLLVRHNSKIDNKMLYCRAFLTQEQEKQKYCQCKIPQVGRGDNRDSDGNIYTCAKCHKPVA